MINIGCNANRWFVNVKMKNEACWESIQLPEKIGQLKMLSFDGKDILIHQTMTKNFDLIITIEEC